MKTKYFYTSLVEISDITLDLGEIELSPDERVHLISLAHANIHSSVINIVLSNLPDEEKKVFLKNLVSQNHEQTWKHLKDNVSDIEDKIKKSINSVKKELREDIQSSKTK